MEISSIRFPIIICSFAYQNVIPSICTSLNNDRSRIRQALFFGTLLTLVVNGLWIIAVIGVLPLDEGSGSLLTAFHQNQPATIPLARDIHSDSIRFCGLLFSMAALFTSYVAVGEGLRNFLADLLGETQGVTGRKMLVAGLAFIPPLTVALIYPQLFLKMLNLVGCNVVSTVQINMFKQRCMDKVHPKVKERYNLKCALLQLQIKKMPADFMGGI